jgi:NifU-like protein involved in Fe-S cluster formation
MKRSEESMLIGELEKMCVVGRGPIHGAAPIPEEGKWVQAKEVKDISGFAHGCGTCAPQMGTSKLTLNVKAGIIQEALIENIGCSGMTQSAAMAAEILPGKTIMEALNTDLVCDAINSAMKQLFLQIVYGRTQSSFSDGGLPIGGAWEDLGASLYSQIGTSYGSLAKGPRYLEVTGGYVTRMGLDENNEVVGYEFIPIGKMMAYVAEGMSANEALEKTKTTFGRFADAVKYIDPRRE